MRCIDFSALLLQEGWLKNQGEGFDMNQAIG